MEQLPHWLMATVFAAGMTAYAEEVDVASTSSGPALDGQALIPPPPPDAIH